MENKIKRAVEIAVFSFSEKSGNSVLTGMSGNFAVCQPHPCRNEQLQPKWHLKEQSSHYTVREFCCLSASSM